jgi:hypoxanthine phosphoribosyltransferase
MVDYFTIEEEKQILEATTVNHHRLTILLMLDAGLRVTEVITLKWEHCDFRLKKITVKSLKKKRITKDANRIIPLTNRLYETFINQANSKKVEELKGYIFPSNKTKSGHTERNSVNMFCNRLQEKLPSVSHINPHKFRHTFATRLRENNQNLEDVKDLLGHEDLKTTFIYSHQSEDAKRKAIGSLEGKQTFIEKIKNKFKQKPILQKIHINSNFLIGRHQEQNLLKSKAEKNQNILIKGSAGIGKNHLLDSMSFGKPILLIDDVKDLKKSLQQIIIHLSNEDKAEVARLILKTKESQDVEIKIQKDSTISLVDILKDLTEPKEYILKIENCENLTPTAANVIDRLKEHFQIITTARAIPLKFLPIFSSFEQIELKELSRRESYMLIQRLIATQIEDAEIVITKVFDSSGGNPQQIKELVSKLNAEPYIDISLADEICNNYLGRSLREIDMSLFLLLILGGFAILRYYGRESGEKDLQFIGGAIMIIMLFARYLFNGIKRKAI